MSGSFRERVEESLLFVQFLAKWYLLAMVAGMVNVGAFLACGRFVTHVTGFATHLGIATASGSWQTVFGMASMPLFFLLGCMLSALAVDRRENLGLEPWFRGPLLLAAGCLAVAGLGGRAGWFGVFGDAPDLASDFEILALLGVASGAQNALLTTISGGVVRSTHLTGTTTDLGIGLVRILFPSPDLDKVESELRKMWLRLGTIVAYVVGSVLGAWLFGALGYTGFLVPAGLTLGTAYICL